MDEEKKIQILMSTYNGEKYLKEQLESIIKLKEFKIIKVLIRDDGSTDKTIDILKEYREKYGFEIILGSNIGITKSIFELLKKSDKNCELFALCDQDDVWINDKFTNVMKKKYNEDNTKPIMYATISEVVSEDLKHIGTTLIPRRKVGFYNAMVQNITPGHTQIYNRKLVDLLIERQFDNVVVVDWWIYLVASGCGKVIFEPRCTVRHRQHGNNSVGYQNNFIKKTIIRVKKINRRDANMISRQLKSFFDIYNDILEEEYKIELEKYLQGLNSVFNRIKYSVITNAYRQTIFETIVFKILYICGKYNI